MSDKHRTRAEAEVEARVLESLAEFYAAYQYPHVPCQANGYMTFAEWCKGRAKALREEGRSDE